MLCFGHKHGAGKQKLIANRMVKFDGEIAEIYDQSLNFPPDKLKLGITENLSNFKHKVAGKVKFNVFPNTVAVIFLANNKMKILNWRQSFRFECRAQNDIA